jgi:flagellar hook-length control protein FliK
VGASLPFDEVIALAASEPRRAHAAASPDVPGQIVRAIAMHWRQGVGEARVHLHPEHLGEVTVALRVEQGSVVAHVRAESAAAVELIRTRQQELHSALEEQGLNLDRLVIDLDTDERRERPAYRQPDPPRPGRRGAGTATFEVIV